MLVATMMLAWAGAIAQSTDQPQRPDPYRHWPPSARADQARYEADLNDAVSPQNLRAFHELLGSEPHYAGTPADLRAAQRIADAFRGMGLDVEMQELWLYLAEPVDAALEIVLPTPLKLSLQEDALPEDQHSQHPELGFGWNAYSGSGDVTAEIVYANRGTKEDFEKLAELGVDVAGKIVVARYGGNFRGYKAKFAEAAGAVGLIIYTDPADSGYARGLMYPEGGYANPSSIQRGSIMTLPYVGDPLTPFKPASKEADRLDPDTVALPKIPVQPVGWGAAAKILSRMKGQAVPKGWQGGLPFTYRVTGGETLTVRLMVQQKRGLKKTYNVLGTLRGSIRPDRKVILGAHYDAWTFGAADPLAGTMVVLEVARSFAAQTTRPARSVVFAAWAAEEFGIIGSTEWVEANRDDLLENAVAYINLDMASMGPDFNCSAAPVLQLLIADATREVRPPPGSSATGGSVFDAWLNRGEDDLFSGDPRFGSLGGGSDHVGFYCHLAIPSAGMGGGGSSGTSYHSNYDTLTWYRKVVGDDYESARMVTQVVNVVAARLANAPLLPIDPVRYGPDIRRHMAALAKHAETVEYDFSSDVSKIEKVSREYEEIAAATHRRLLSKLEDGSLSDAALACANDVLIKLERNWYYSEGLPGGREWFKSLYAATDPNSGYSAWMLPAYRWALDQEHTGNVATARRAYFRVIYQLINDMKRIETCMGGE